MLWTIDFFVLQEDAVTLAGAHEVVITAARSEAAANCGSWLLTLLTVLNKKKRTGLIVKREVKLSNNNNNNK